MGESYLPVPEPRVAGRKPLPPEERKIQRTMILKPATLAQLEAMRGPGESLGSVVDRLMAAQEQP